MQLRRWEELPEFMRNEKVKVYYKILSKKCFQLKVKRFFDIIMSLFLMIVFLPIFVMISILVKLDSKGPVFYKQERITQYGREFRIIKFRTMIVDAERKGSLVTIKHDPRITKVGEKLRKLRLDEIPQLFNIFMGDMSFVGTRPEIPKYVLAYTDEMKATLLLPAGVTSKASIRYRNEDELLRNARDADKVYVQEVLPEKMKWNLKAIKEFGIIREIYTMIETVLVVVGVQIC